MDNYKLNKLIPVVVASVALSWNAYAQDAQNQQSSQSTQPLTTMTATDSSSVKKITLQDAITKTANEITDEMFGDLMAKYGIQKNIGEVVTQNRTLGVSGVRDELEDVRMFYPKVKNRLGLLARSIVPSPNGPFKMGKPGKEEDRKLLERLVENLNAQNNDNLELSESLQ